MSENARLALVTGATGYIGGQVAQELLRRGWRVRLLSRSAEKVRNLPWGDSVVAEGRSAGPGEAEVVEGNASEAADVARALQDVDVAWYLLHSMGDSDDFVQEALVVALSLVNLLTIMVILVRGGTETRTTGAVLGLLGILLTWAMLHLMYGARYAHEYYRHPQGGIDFNDREPRGTWTSSTSPSTWA